MKSWDQFYPDVLPEIPADTPNPTVDRALVRVAQDFMRKTRCWRRKLDAVYLFPGILEYDINLDTNTSLVRIERATLFDECYRVGRIEDVPCGGCFIYAVDGRTIRLNTGYPELEDGDTAPDRPLVLDVTLMPSTGALGIDDVIFERYSETIARGAIARIAKSAAYQQLYDNDCDRINVEVWRGQAATRPRTRPVYF